MPSHPLARGVVVLALSAAAAAAQPQPGQPPRTPTPGDGSRAVVAAGWRSPGPPNDSCGGAIDLGLVPGGAVAMIGDSTGATDDPPSPLAPPCLLTSSSMYTGSVGVWYRFTGTGNRVHLDTCLQASDLVLRVYCGAGGCAAPVCAASDDDGCVSNTLGASVDLCTTAGVPYLILLSRYGAAVGGGQFLLNASDNGVPCAGQPACAVVPAPPPNDDCTGATPITIGALVEGTTIDATPDAVSPPSCVSIVPSGAATLWYRVTGTGDRLRVSTCNPGTGSNTILQVFTGSCPGAGGGPACIGGASVSSPVCSPRDDAATVDFCSVAGQDYLVRVCSDLNGAGYFQLLVSTLGACPANDACSGAITLPVPGSAVADTRNASLDAPAPPCTASITAPGVWYRVVGTGNRFQADTCDTSSGQFDTRLSVYCGYTPGVDDPCAALGSLTCIVGNDNATAAPPAGCGSLSQQSLVTWCTQAGAAYLILVHGGTGTQGPVGITTLTLRDLGPCTGAIACAPMGACCVAGACSVSTRAACAGAYLGDGVPCSSGDATPNLPIPDNSSAGVASSMTIAPGAGTITDLDVGLLIAHTWQGDLRITLQHDAGPEVLLVDRPGYPQSGFGFSADNFGNPTSGMTFILDDQAGALYDSPPQGSVSVPGINSVTGRWRPDPGPLSSFSGQSLSGVWTLRVYDLAAGETGTLRAWSLLSTPAPPNRCPTTPLGPDCFTRLINGQPPQNAGHYTRGGPDGVLDSTECVGDWDRNGQIAPADVASYVSSWFYSTQNPGNLDADVDCSGDVSPADVAVFVNHWFSGLASSPDEGC